MNRRTLWFLVCSLPLLIAVGMVCFHRGDAYDRTESERLLAAVSLSDRDNARQALDQGADPNYWRPVQRPLPDAFVLQLHSLCIWNRNLASGARRELARGTGTPLQIAVQNGQAEMVRLLLARGARPDAGPRGSLTPLMLAAGSGTGNGRESMARLLLAAGANPNATVSAAPGAVPHTALRMAAFSANPRPMVRLLVAHGALCRDGETCSQMKRLGITLKNRAK